MNSGGDASVRQIANNSSSFTGDSFSSPVADSPAHSSYQSQTDSFAVDEGPTPYGVSEGFGLAGFFVSHGTPVNDPYEVARSLIDEARQSNDYEDLWGQQVTGQPQQLHDVLRAIFEIGASYPPGSDDRWSAVSVLFAAFALAGRRGDQKVASWIDDYISDLGYTLHITLDRAPDNGASGVITYQISGPDVPMPEAPPPRQEEPPPPPDAPPPVRPQRSMRREQVAAEEQPLPADRPPDQTLEARAMPAVAPETATEQSLPASGDQLDLGYAAFGDIFAATLDSERNSFLARRAEQRKNGARLPSAPDPDVPIAPLICVCDDDRSM